MRTSLAGAGLIAWSVLVVATADSGAATAAAILPNLAALVVCVFGATFLLSANMRVLGSTGGASSARLAALLRPPLANVDLLNWQAFEGRVGLIFGDFQAAWSARDLARMRAYLSDRLFETQVL